MRRSQVDASPQAPPIPAPQEVIDDTENIKGGARRVILADAINRCPEEDEQDDIATVTAIRNRRSFTEALDMEHEYLVFEITDGE